MYSECTTLVHWKKCMNSWVMAAVSHTVWYLWTSVLRPDLSAICISNDRHDSVLLCILPSMNKMFIFFIQRAVLKLKSDTYPVHAWLVHAFWVFLQFKLLTVDPRTFNVSRQMRHVGDPGHCSLVGRGWGIEGRWRLGALKRKASTLNMRTWVLKWMRAA